MFDPNKLISISVLVLVAYIAIILLANIQASSSCEVGVSGNDILVEDNFNDNSIDLTKWQLINLFNVISEVNQQLEFSLTSALTGGTIFSSAVSSSGKVTIQAFISQSNPTTPNTVEFSLSGSNEAVISLSPNADNIFVAQGVSTGITGGKDVKIEYDFDTFDINYYYWDGSAWIVMRTENRDLAEGGSLLINITGDGRSGNPVDDSVGIVDNAFFTAGTYTIHYPNQSSSGISQSLSNACHALFNNAGVLFVLAGVLLLLLVIPMIRGVVGGKQ